MAQNTTPIFPLAPRASLVGAVITAANTTKDGTAGTLTLVFTSKAVDGSRVDYLKVRALGTNVATVMRVFINNGADPTVAGNNGLFMERTIPATTLSEVAELADNYIPLDIALPADYRIYVTIGTAVAAGLKVIVIGGDY
jgi:hypothetical protein